MEALHVVLTSLSSLAQWMFPVIIFILLLFCIILIKELRTLNKQVEIMQPTFILINSKTDAYGVTVDNIIDRTSDSRDSLALALQAYAMLRLVKRVKKYRSNIKKWGRRLVK